MRLESIDVDLIRKAVGTFLEEAWGDLASSHWPGKVDFASADASGVLSGFSDERRRGCMRKYTLRLGNRRYPFMKVVLQELLFRDVFFFSVDTHDELDIKETTPDYSEWLDIRKFNADLKRRVERRWRDEDVPTLGDVLDAVECDEVPKSQCCPDGTEPQVFIADDDEDIATGVRRVLERRGYCVEVFPSAEAALSRIREKKPHLVISDLEMGEGLSGIEFCEELRCSRDTRALPFILATASGIDLTQHTVLDGFLVKPYDIDALVKLVSAHLPDPEDVTAN